MIVLKCKCGKTVRPYLPNWRRMKYRSWGMGYVFLCDGTMLPNHVKDYYPFKSLRAQEEIVSSVGDCEVKCMLYHLDRRLKSVMRLRCLLHLTLPQAAKIVRELRDSASSIDGFRMFATEHPELNLQEVLRTWKHIDKHEVTLFNTPQT